MRNIVVLLVLILVLAIATAVTFVRNQTTVFRIQGSSMEPNLPDGTKYTLVPVKASEIRRGDILLYNVDNGDIDYAQRVIALPGETIRISNGQVYLNEVLLQETYIKGKTIVWKGGFTKENIPIVVPAESYWFMGDNRERSSDSRDKGPVSEKDILGKVNLLNSR